MKLTVIALLMLEEGLFELGEKELHVSTSLTIRHAITNLGSITHSIRETAQPILKKKKVQQEKELAELYQQEMDVALPSIQVNELSEIKVSARLLEKIQPMLEEGVV